MRNTVYTYNTREVDNFEVPDYTSAFYGYLYSLISAKPEYFTFIDVTNDEKIENVSYQLYGSENYSDLILACNNENFLWSMPYNQDIVIEQSKVIINNIREELNIDSNNPIQDFIDFSNYVVDSLDTLNSQKRRFRVPKPENLGDVLSLVTNYREEYNDTNWRLDLYD